MKKFKNMFLLAAMAVSAVCVVSCGEDDDDNGGGSLSITAVVENGNDYNALIDEVKVIVYGNGMDVDTFATGKYANGGFTLVLPAMPDDKYLSLIENVMGSAGSGAKVSDDTAKGLFISSNFHLYKSGQQIGYFSYEPDFMYVDKDVTITGSWDASLKKGWNILYPKGSGSYGYTTTPPSTPYKWSVDLYGN